MQHIHINNGKTFLLVEVEASGQDFYALNSLGILEYDTDTFTSHTTEITLPSGNWQIIGKASVLIEVQAKVDVARLELNSLLRSLNMQPETTLILQLIVS